MTNQINKNKNFGETFEKIFQRQGKTNGLFIHKNPLSARFIGIGKMLPVKSQLDFLIINPQGKVAYVDCKCYTKSYFTYAKLNEKQVERAVTFNDWNVQSGFVSWFRESNEVVFFSGRKIEELGMRTRFDKSNGIVLGTVGSFDLKLLFT